MATHTGTIVQQRRMGFFSSVVWSLAAIIMTTVGCAMIVVVYGMSIVDQRSESVLSIVERVAGELPNIAESPIIGEAIGHRLPDYRDQLDVDVTFTEVQGRDKYMAPLLKIHNRGDRTIGFMAVRLLIRDGEGRLVDEMDRFAAFPVAGLDDDLPGPILPGETRSLVTGWIGRGTGLEADIEISDIRVQGSAALPRATQTLHAVIPDAIVTPELN